MPARLWPRPSPPHHARAIERRSAQPASDPPRASERARPRAGPASDPALALALQRKAGNRATVRALQRYAERKYTFSTWRQAGDMTTATRIGDGNHQLYAKPARPQRRTRPCRRSTPTSS